LFDCVWVCGSLKSLPRDCDERQFGGIFSLCGAISGGANRRLGKRLSRLRQQGVAEYLYKLLKQPHNILFRQWEGSGSRSRTAMMRPQHQGGYQSA